MKYPFIKQIDDIYCLTEDTVISTLVEEAGSLDWDKSLQVVIQAVKWLNKKGIVIDVGAYIGDSTRSFLNAGLSVVAFEPQSDAFLCLLHNCSEAQCVNFPVGNGELVSPLYCNGGNMGGRWVSENDNGTPTLQLDDMDVGEVACIKIDAEGWEPNVLLGAEKTIRDHRPVVVVEFNPHALERAGFTCEDILCHFQDWQQEEVYRYGDENWDIMFTWDRP